MPTLTQAPPSDLAANDAVGQQTYHTPATAFTDSFNLTDKAVAQVIAGVNWLVSQGFLTREQLCLESMGFSGYLNIKVKGYP